MRSGVVCPLQVKSLLYLGDHCFWSRYDIAIDKWTGTKIVDGRRVQEKLLETLNYDWDSVFYGACALIQYMGPDLKKRNGGVTPRTVSRADFALRNLLQQWQNTANKCPTNRAVEASWFKVSCDFYNTAFIHVRTGCML